jgi:catechol 2,3-dioxygenase-like lactoylglutathione lyase family enzyme
MAMTMPAEWTFTCSIPAKDLDGTRRFYEDVLGVEVVRESQGGITYRSGGSVFLLTPRSSPGPPGTLWVGSWSRTWRPWWRISGPRA